MEFGINVLPALFQSLGFSVKEPFIQFLTSMAEYKEVPPNTAVIHQGSKIDYLYFLLDGSLKKVIVEDGREQILALYDAGNIITNYNSIIYNLDSESSFITLQKSRFLQFDFGHFPKVKESEYKPIFTNAFMTLMNRSLNFHLKVAKLLMLSNEDKYKQVNNEFVDIFNKFSIKNIASFLGMRPETLSRMRSSIFLGD